MNQSAYIVAALLFLFFVYITTRGQLGQYIALIL